MGSRRKADIRKIVLRKLVPHLRRENTMSKISTAAKASNVVSLVSVALGQLADAAFKQARNRSEVADLIKRAVGPKGKAQTARLVAARMEYMAGRMAFTLNVPLDTARKLLTYANANGKGQLKKGQGRRNKEQEKAYNAAKVYWSDMLRAAGLVSPSAKAGNSNAKGKTATRAPHHKDKSAPVLADVFAKPKAPAPSALPKAKTREDVENYVLQQALSLAAFINKNAAVASPQCSTIVQDFVTAAKIALAPARGNKG